MALYPLMLELKDRPCLVVGGGSVAERKVGTLLSFEAQVTVIAPEVTPDLEAWAGEGRIEWEKRPYAPGDSEQRFLVIAATDSPEVNAQVACEAHSRNCLVNVVDDPQASDFFVPASVRRGDLVIGISTSGQNPTLARFLREEMEEHFGPEYGHFTALIGEMRDYLKALGEKERVEAIRRMVKEGVLDLIRQGQMEEARRKAIRCISI